MRKGETFPHGNSVDFCVLAVNICKTERCGGSSFGVPINKGSLSISFHSTMLSIFNTANIHLFYYHSKTFLEFWIVCQLQLVMNRADQVIFAYSKANLHRPTYEMNRQKLVIKNIPHALSLLVFINWWPFQFIIKVTQMLNKGQCEESTE